MNQDETFLELSSNWQMLEENFKAPKSKLLVEKKGDPSFCYMLGVDKSDSKLFKSMQKELELDGELVDPSEFHVTVRYVKGSTDYDPFIQYLNSLELPTIKAKCVGFDVFGKDKDTLVVKLEGDEIHDWFNKVNKWLTDNDYPKSDFPTFKPHVSLTEKPGIEKPEWKDEWEEEVTFSFHVIGDSNHEEVFKEKA